jgi:hypothetical protein
METSAVRRQVDQAIERAHRTAVERRVRADQAAQDYASFLDRTAIPLFRQIADALRAAGYTFTVSTPGGSVRLASERTSADFVELTLDTSGDEPRVIGRASRGRGRRILEFERPLGPGAIATITEEDLLSFVVAEIAPFVER